VVVVVVKAGFNRPSSVTDFYENGDMPLRFSKSREFLDMCSVTVNF